MDFAKAVREHEIACYVASTQEAYRASYLENRLGLNQHFDGFFFSWRLACQKPEPRFYELVSSQLPVDLHEVLFFDDNSKNIDGARKAGWNAELVTFGTNPVEVAAKYGVLANDR